MFVKRYRALSTQRYNKNNKNEIKVVNFKFLKFCACNPKILYTFYLNNVIKCPHSRALKNEYSIFLLLV